MTGIVFDIQRFAIHDGPGIRTTVFFKGCSARCGWCHNPESLAIRPQIQYYIDRCVHCGGCVQVCPQHAHASDGHTHIFNRDLCISCGLCASACLHNALVVSGREMKLEDVLHPILDDKPYYDQSGGGVTLSGGEPVLQNDFCKNLLVRLKKEGIHTALQTAGFYPFERLSRLLPHLDLVMYDIKGVSPEIFRDHIHADAVLPWENLNRLDESGVPFIVRTPCVGSVNDRPEEIEKIACRLSALKHLQYYALVPYHGLAKVKYDVLGRMFNNYETPDKEHIQRLAQLAKQYVPIKPQEP